VTESNPVLAREPAAREVLSAVERAVELARSSAPSVPGTVEQLGQGWVAEEALALSLFCALRAESFEHGVRLAVNHGGDSDSTGSLTGQLLGTLWGEPAIPARWLAELELRDIIEDIAADMAAALDGSPVEGARSYPPW
jgi:ADP-ribosylglycohydrolase